MLPKTHLWDKKLALVGEITDAFETNIKTSYFSPIAPPCWWGIFMPASHRLPLQRQQIKKPPFGSFALVVVRGEGLFFVLRLVFFEHCQLTLKLRGKPLVQLAADLIHTDPLE